MADGRGCRQRGRAAIRAVSAGRGPRDGPVERWHNAASCWWRTPPPARRSPGCASSTFRAIADHRGREGGRTRPGRCGARRAGAAGSQPHRSRRGPPSAIRWPPGDRDRADRSLASTRPSPPGAGCREREIPQGPPDHAAAPMDARSRGRQYRRDDEPRRAGGNGSHRPRRAGSSAPALAARGGRRGRCGARRAPPPLR